MVDRLKRCVYILYIDFFFYFYICFLFMLYTFYVGRNLHFGSPRWNICRRLNFGRKIWITKKLFEFVWKTSKQQREDIKGFPLRQKYSCELVTFIDQTCPLSILFHSFQRNLIILKYGTDWSWDFYVRGSRRSVLELESFY